MVGKTISHYRIVSQLGTGGMGIVYAAEDQRLGRSVALKFVPDDLAKDEQALQRLRGEARTASTLNHPNICTIHDIGEYEGRPFIVMELLKGQTLRDRLAAGPLKIHEIVDIGIQVADALDWAHTSGVIHRDIKPANLFLVDRRQIKILDFGLAKLLSRQPSSGSTGAPTIDPTAAGVTLGTVAYMSPEQITGEELDGRTDIFSLGVVLYESATGHQPFTGKTSAVVLSAILNKAPVAPLVFNPDLPLRLQEVINNCLEKDRELRYQHADGLRADLRRIKRDLESGHSGAMTATGILAGRSGVTPAPEPTVARPDSAQSRSRTLEPSSMRRGSFGIVAVVLAVVGLTLAGTATYLWWRPAPQSTTAVGSGGSETLVQRQLDAATASLRASNYQAALSQSEEVLRADPNRAEAIRIRDEAKAMIARFDEAVAKATALLASGDADAATVEVDRARSIDPAAPIVNELSTRLVNQFKARAEAARKGSQASAGDARRESPRPAAAANPPTSTPEPSPQAPTPPPAVVVPSAALANAGTQTAVRPPAPSTSNAPAQPVPPEPSPSAREPVAAAPPPPAARRETPAPTPPANEDDETVIRRVIATYARAIETKDVALFRSIKPNMSRQEQQRIEEGFRAVSSQRVNITILAIDRRGDEASVRLRRSDTIDAGGRQQTSETQQTMTLVRSGATWVISAIGR
jgi:Protein kinase domain